jgi:3-phosphoshikimate 1-carboxyvinyltransferase
MKLDNIDYLQLTLPGDKSIAHRALILASFIKGVHKINNLPKNEDVLITLDILSRHGLEYKFSNNSTIINSNNMLFKDAIIACNDSGTTARLLIGYLAGLNINTTIKGSLSLSRRPMRRIVNPLKDFGVNIESKNFQLPIKLNKSNNLKPFNFRLEIPSAQVKSALILYAMCINGKSILSGKIQTRDHLELLLADLDYPISIDSDKIQIIGNANISKQIDIKIPGDISSASFIICASLLTQGSYVRIKNVCINKYRIGFLNSAVKMGAKINILNNRLVYGEAVGDIDIHYSKDLKGIEIDSIEIVNMIDEIPILSVLACYAEGNTIINGIEELKVKESNRVLAIIENIQSMGGDAELINDSLIIKGNKRLYNTTIRSFNDHRIFMSFYIANRIIGKNVDYDVSDTSYNKSFPDFKSVIERVLR